MNQKRQIFWLLISTSIGFCLRFANLDGKPPWTDEFSSLVFSLGNSFLEVPLNQVINLATLLHPLVLRADANTNDVIHHLLTESNHPPLYFILSHWWTKLFDHADHLISLNIARSLPALFSVATIPAMYIFGKIAFRSNLIAQLAAACMAVSPYAIYLAQEIRHYSLAILFVIASLTCFSKAIQIIKDGKILPIWLVIIWIIINSLGIAIHYFLAIALAAEALVLIWFLGFSGIFRSDKIRAIGGEALARLRAFLRFGLVAVGTMAGGLVWLPLFLPKSYDSELTKWIVEDNQRGLNIISPIFQALAGWITMISLLPVESTNLLIIVISVIIMVAFFLWFLPILKESLKQAGKQPEIKLEITALTLFVGISIAIFFGFTYIFGIDLTRGARYNFVYFPGVMLLLAVGLAMIYPQPDVKSEWLNFPHVKINGKKAIAIIWLMGVLSCITVVSDLGYQKYYRPDLLIPLIKTDQPVLIATTYKTHVQIGELMGLGYQFSKKCPHLSYPKNCPSLHSLQFLLAQSDRQKPEKSDQILLKNIANLASPLELWLVNFETNANLAQAGCQIDRSVFPAIDGYNYQHYHCT